jgi:glycosyltransferase involved in cell wall biosynthesis
MPNPLFHLIVLGNALPEPGTLDGASRICLEVVARWLRDGVATVTCITSERRRQTCEKYRWTTGVEYVHWPDAPGVWSMAGHLRAALHGRKSAARLPLPITALPTVIYSASDFLPDVWAAHTIRRRLRNAKWVASRFLFVPNPLKGWKNSYEKGLRLPSPTLVAARGYQGLSFHTILKADAWFITNEVDTEYFPKDYVAKGLVKAVYGGVDFHDIHNTPDQPRKYDGVFCGRISPQKGVLDLIDIWRRVCDKKPVAKLALIGNGHKPFEDELRASIRVKGLEPNVDWLGFMDGATKHEVYKQSAVFLHTSVYDNYGMAACEAMAAGVPAVLYDLPPLRVAYPTGCLKARRNDPQHFAELVLSVMDDPATRDRLGGEAVRWAETQDWDNKAAELLAFLQEKVLIP